MIFCRSPPLHAQNVARASLINMEKCLLVTPHAKPFFMPQSPWSTPSVVSLSLALSFCSLVLSKDREHIIFLNNHNIGHVLLFYSVFFVRRSCEHRTVPVVRLHLPAIAIKSIPLARSVVFTLCIQHARCMASAQIVKIARRRRRRVKCLHFTVFPSFSMRFSCVPMTFSLVFGR